MGKINKKKTNKFKSIKKALLGRKKLLKDLKKCIVREKKIDKSKSQEVGQGQEKKIKRIKIITNQEEEANQKIHIESIRRKKKRNKKRKNRVRRENIDKDHKKNRKEKNQYKKKFTEKLLKERFLREELAEWINLDVLYSCMIQRI